MESYTEIHSLLLERSMAGLNKLTVIIRRQSLYCTPVCCMLTRAKTLELTVHATRHNQPHAISTWAVTQFTSCQYASGMFAMLDCNFTTSCDNMQVGVAPEWRVVVMVLSYTSVASLFLWVQKIMRGEPVACSTVLYSSSRLDPCLGSEISNIAQNLSNRQSTLAQPGVRAGHLTSIPPSVQPQFDTVPCRADHCIQHANLIMSLRSLNPDMATWDFCISTSILDIAR
ncbi:hypothetical protein D6D17_06628 [Aureobasidium pullulans]|nr:hypothetical protein D6D17_06628 [Aureobasidium pullulans]